MQDDERKLNGSDQDGNAPWLPAEPDLRALYEEGGRTGLRLRHLTFHKHPLAERLEQVPEDAHHLVPHMRALSSAVQAVVQFQNGWSLSIIAYEPDDRDTFLGFKLMLLHGDLRIPTYEVAVYDADHNMVGDPYYDLSVPEVERLMAITMSEGYVGGKLELGASDDSQ